MPSTNFKTYAQGETKLQELGYQRCEPQHIKLPTALCACWKNAEKGSHVCLSKRGSQMFLDLVKEG